MKTNKIQIAINLHSEGIEDQNGELHFLDIKECWKLATDEQFQWGENIPLVYEVLQHNFINAVKMTREQWYTSYHNYRCYFRSLRREEDTLKDYYAEEHTLNYL